MSDFVNWLWKAIVTPEGAGAVGSIVSLRWAPGDSWLIKLSSVAGGMAFAIFIVPWLIEYMEVKSAKAPLAMAFIGGLVGMNLLAKTWAYVQSVDFRELLNVILRRQEPPKEKQ